MLYSKRAGGGSVYPAVIPYLYRKKPLTRKCQSPESSRDVLLVFDVPPSVLCASGRWRRSPTTSVGTRTTTLASASLLQSTSSPCRALKSEIVTSSSSLIQSQVGETSYSSSRDSITLLTFTLYRHDAASL